MFKERLSCSKGSLLRTVEFSRDFRWRHTIGYEQENRLLCACCQFHWSSPRWERINITRFIAE